ncbi:MAG TPA: glycosyltransferase family 4 protein [Sediminibacterium sp.]|nr:glycosyltransferase family 4 protein [Sediminibacterium sp.]
MKQVAQIQKPTILFIHNTYLQKGGEDSVVQNEIAVLQKKGYTVYYKEFDNRSFQKRSWRSIFLPLNIFFNINAFFTIYYLVKKNQIPIVHVHNFFYNASPAVFWAAKAAGAKTLFTLHNYRLFCLNGIFFRAGAVCFDCHNAGNFKKGVSEKCFKSSGLFSKTLAWSTILHRKIGTWKNKVDRFVVINPFMKQLLVETGIPPYKIVFKPNVLAEYTQKTIGASHEREDFYLYVGRLNTEKGIHHLVEAFKQSGKKLVIVGDGELAGFVKQNLTENIAFRGALSKQAVSQLYDTCKALVFSSLWIEGMPMTIIEAQSAGTIVIAAESVNTKTMIESGINGFLYEAGNINSLIEVINIFESKSNDELNRLSVNARQYFLENYTETQFAEAAGKLYQ